MRSCLKLLWIALLVASGASAHATMIDFAAPLDGASEFPPNASTGSGVAQLVFDTDAHTVSLDIDFSGLSAPVTVAHIHCCVDPSSASPVVGVAVTPGTLPGFPAGVTAGAYNMTLDLSAASTYTTTFLAAAGGTAAAAEAALLTGMQAGFAYVNIHTSAFPAGEIRGFLQAVPEPLTGLLLMTASVGLVWRRRRACS
ncbi:MAG: CHRD domain-containing protein [Gammaproteobacteria bacterium]|nr:CHRD domain-containing protein [Gammaproteobacteria bacterium]